MSDNVERHSRALQIDLITDPEEIAKQEARNGLRQFDAVIDQIEYWLHPERPFRLRPSGILTLNRIALEGINGFAGIFRPGIVEIGGSKHAPPGAHLVAESVEHMCDYVNENWNAKSPIHLASYVMWRLNWIHPFTDGNGRTTRAVSYLVLCIRLGYRLPGTYTIPALIAADKPPYYRALELADAACATGNVDVSAMETLLEGHLASQLASVLDAAKQNPVHT